MRILLDQVTYDMRNKGNIALVQASVKRLKELWPEASLEIITLGPLLSRIYVPDCDPAPLLNTNKPNERWKTLNSFHSLIPRTLLRLFFEMRDEYHHRKSQNKTGGPMISKAEVMAYQKETLNKELLNGVDLFVISGAQFLCDSVKHLALAILDRLQFAMELGIPIVMVGQGIGPIDDPELAARAREVLPLVDFILVREKVFAPSLLCSLGVSQDRIFVTGDDAIEMGYEARSTKKGKYVGLGMRVSNYTGVKDRHLEDIRQVLREVSLNHATEFISIPISYSTYEWELDDFVIERLSSGRNVIRRGFHRYEEPLSLIRLVGKCRLVVTGAFHPAVFALSQGIPAICLSSSESYTNKFIGLADLFGEGCKVLYMNDKEFQTKLASAIDSIWNSADQLRPQLLEAASRQIKWGHDGYQHIYEVVNPRIKKLAGSRSTTKLMY